jgi:hypothetical protein
MKEAKPSKPLTRAEILRGMGWKPFKMGRQRPEANAAETREGGTPPGGPESYGRDPLRK